MWQEGNDIAPSRRSEHDREASRLIAFTQHCRSTAELLRCTGAARRSCRLRARSRFPDPNMLPRRNAFIILVGEPGVMNGCWGRMGPSRLTAPAPDPTGLLDKYRPHNAGEVLMGKIWRKLFSHRVIPFLGRKIRAVGYKRVKILEDWVR